MSNKDRVLEIVEDILGEKVDSETSMTSIDSLDASEIIMELEEEFDVTIDEGVAAKWKTLGDVIEFVNER